MPAFTPNEWFVVILVFVLGLLLGMAAMAGGKWKRLYREEVRKRQAAEADRARFESQARQAETRAAAATPPPPPPAPPAPPSRRDTPIA